MTCKKSHHLLPSQHTRVCESKDRSPTTAEQFKKIGLCLCEEEGLWESVTTHTKALNTEQCWEDAQLPEINGEGQGCIGLERASWDNDSHSLLLQTAGLEMLTLNWSHFSSNVTNTGTDPNKSCSSPLGICNLCLILKLNLLKANEYPFVIAAEVSFSLNSF